MSNPVKKAPQVAALRAKLEAERDRLQAILQTAREFYDQHVNDPRYLEVRRIIKDINAQLFPILNELAAIARPTAKASIKAETGEYSQGK